MVSFPPPPNTKQAATASPNEVSRRLRMLEETVVNLRRKVEIDEQNTIRELKQIKNDVSLMFSEMEDVRSTVKQFKDEMIKVIEELQTTAKKDEVTSIKKYIDLWEPVKFVTANNVRNIVSDMLEGQEPRVVEKVVEKPIEKEHVEKEVGIGEEEHNDIPEADSAEPSDDEYFDSRSTNIKDLL